MVKYPSMQAERKSEELNRSTAFDNKLRPTDFDGFVGQDKVRERMLLAVKAAKDRGESLDHVLFSGPPGLGKTTLSYILGEAMGVNVKTTSGPVITKPGDLAGLLTSLEPGDIVFIDEIHRMAKAVEEYLYSAMEDYAIDIMLDQGPNARSVRLELPRFTLVGATTRIGLIAAPLRARFGLVNRLDYYEPAEIAEIVKRSAAKIGVDIDGDGALEIARRARGTPRISITDTMLSSTLILRNTEASCGRYPMPRWARWYIGRPVISSSSRKTRPSLGTICPVIM